MTSADNPESDQMQTTVNAKKARKAMVATSLGNAMEWFDFGIYAYLAVTMGKVFFPQLNGTMQLIYTLATFAISFLIRPIGGLVFGRLGDRWGRKRVLTITVIMMALSTLSIGLIPSYDTIGVLASILLLLARLVQGFSTGGEYAGAMTFITESSPDKRRGFLASGLEVGTLVGFIAGAGLVTFLTYILSSEQMVAWGWRIPFLVAGPIGLIGLYLRTHLEETPAFETMQKREKSTLPLLQLFKSYWKPIMIGMALVFTYNVLDYMLLTYMPSHLQTVLNYGETESLLLIVLIMILMIPLVLLMGHLSDRFDHKYVVQGGLIGLIVVSWFAFMMISSGKTVLLFIGLLFIALFLTTFQGTMPSLLPSLFPTEVRQAGLSITYNVSTSLFGGPTPMVMAWLIAKTNNYYIPAYFLIFAGIVGFIVVTFFVRKMAGKPLPGSLPQVEREEKIS